MRIFHYEKIYIATDPADFKKHYFSGELTAEDLMSAMENYASYRWDVEELAVPEGYDSEDAVLETPVFESTLIPKDRVYAGDPKTGSWAQLYGMSTEPTPEQTQRDRMEKKIDAIMDHLKV